MEESLGEVKGSFESSWTAQQPYIKTPRQQKADFYLCKDFPTRHRRKHHRMLESDKTSESSILPHAMAKKWAQQAGHMTCPRHTTVSSSLTSRTQVHFLPWLGLPGATQLLPTPSSILPSQLTTERFYQNPKYQYFRNKPCWHNCVSLTWAQWYFQSRSWLRD